MKHTEQTIGGELRGVRRYGVILVAALLVLHIAALGMLAWVEKNEIRSELAVWSRTITKPVQGEPIQSLHLPQDILAFHAPDLKQTGFYETMLDKDYLAYANPDNSYILMKSEDSMEHEIVDFAFVLGALFVGEIILLLGWWRFVRSKVRELFEVA